EAPPADLKLEYQTLLSPDAIQFLAELVVAFDKDVDQVCVIWVRKKKKKRKEAISVSPDQSSLGTLCYTDPEYCVTPLCHGVPRLMSSFEMQTGETISCKMLRKARYHHLPLSAAQWLQVDFDDGNCPTLSNQIKGIFNVYKAVRNQFPVGAPPISKAPILMLRPRAWNMVEHAMMVNGKEVPGPLFDFGLLMYHTGRILFENESGPFFYLSKVESYLEARLWSQIFVWTETKLGLPLGSIKATVLIENILATFEMEEILYELKAHSAGLNCGIWDYCASFVNNFGHRPEFILPDRSKYVNMEKLFLKSYMELLVQTCHRRGALATGGMAALLLPKDKGTADYQRVLATVTRLKLYEINAGVDGFMVYDFDLVEPMQKLFQEHTKGPNQLHILRADVVVTLQDLLSVPAGGVTLYGLKYNIGVGILFIEAWLRGQGHYHFRGQVEDSATAEISRSQVWQWIRHRVRLEDDGRMINRSLVQSQIKELEHELQECFKCSTEREKERLCTATKMFLEIVQKRDFPPFITTYLNLDHTFLASSN
uniref:malate synthase n=1 Tax=Latimeria chalumnae TaxID=7897 RepID=H3B0Y8_LATCH